jgi:type II secretory pathway pseudopilin PulG
VTLGWLQPLKVTEQNLANASMRAYSPLHNQHGVTLMVVVLMMLVMGLAAGMAGNTWRNVMQREREEELFFRGEQYRRAIESYFKMAHAGAKGAYPKSVEELLKDPRSLQTLRHLRQPYKDPFTGEEFELVREGGSVTGLPGAAQSLAGIRGVRSTSSLEPFKKDRFLPPYEEFAKAATYGDWKFVFTPAPAAQPGAAQPPVPGVGQPPLPGQTMPGQPMPGPPAGQDKDLVGPGTEFR